MPDLIYFGDAVKALDDKGKVGGYLVRFSDSDSPRRDLSGEYFTSKSYLGARDGDGVDVLFHHGQPLPVDTSKLTKTARKEIEGFQNYIFAPVKTKRDAIGVWAETVLDLANAYEEAVFGFVKQGKLGWSSGALGHQVMKSAGGEITRWIIGEASLTPTPAEPLNRALELDSLKSIKLTSIDQGDDEPPAKVADRTTKTSLGSYLNQLIDDRVDEGRTRERIVGQMAKAAGIDVKAVEAVLANQERPADAHLKAFARVLGVEFGILQSVAKKNYRQTIKGMFAEAVEAQTPSRWELESTYSSVVRKLASAASAASVAGIDFDLEAMLTEATDEYTTLLLQHALAQINDWLDAGADEDFYFKAILDAEAKVNSFDATDLDTHTQLTVHVLRGLKSRYRGNHEARLKRGAVLSEKNRQRIASLIEQGEAVFADLKALLEETQPMASDVEKRAALTKHLMLKHQHRELGVF
jgi:hypothetical protein